MLVDLKNHLRCKFRRIVLEAEQTGPSFFVGVLHVNREPWLSIVKDGQINSWTLQRYKNFEVIYFHSNSSKLSKTFNRVIENLRWKRGRIGGYFISFTLMAVLAPWRNSIPKTIESDPSVSGIEFRSIQVNFPEMISTIRWKKIVILKHFLMSPADFLIITNSSSLLNFEPIVAFLKEVSSSDVPFYGGPIHKGYDGEFVSGSFTIINRVAAEALLINRRIIPLHVMDDIGFSTGLRKMGVSPVNLDSLVVDSEEKVKQLKDSEIRNASHFRLKSGTTNLRNDVSIAREILQRLVKL